MNPTSPFTMPGSLPTEPVNQESAIVSPEQLRSHLEPSVGQQPQAPVEEKKNFGSFQKDASSKKGINFSLQIMTATTGGLILLVIGLLFFFLTKVNIRGSSNDTTNDTTVQSYKSMVLSIDEVLGYPGISQYESLQSASSVDQLKDIIGSTIPFIFKKDIVTRLVEQLKLTILRNNQESKTLSQEITKYGFIHSDVMGLMEDSKDKIPIITSLHTLETVKFGTAIKLFSMLDTFLQEAASALGMSKQSTIDTINSYIDDGESYISNYLFMCYLNPYERLPDCNQINDFENYFKYEKPNTTVNYNAFSKILELVEKRLETSSVASVKIDFNRFDPNAKNIAFQVTISTLAEDEAAFLSKGILNPHVFILSTLVNLLKQSLFVIGDGISVQNITVKEQNITIGNVQIPVKTSSMSFDLPLQNSSQREIFDYLDVMKY